MRRLLLDQGLPRSTAETLREANVDAVHSRATETEILEYAANNDRVVVTLDADFHTILALQEASGPSVVRIRIEGLKGPELAALLLGADEAIAQSLAAGAAVSITPNNIRIHRLPLADDTRV